MTKFLIPTLAFFAASTSTEAIAQGKVLGHKEYYCAVQVASMVHAMDTDKSDDKDALKSITIGQIRKLERTSGHCAAWEAILRARGVGQRNP